MNLGQELQNLRNRLDQMAREADVGLLERYVLYPPPPDLSAYRRFRIALGRVLRRWGLRRPPPPEPWLPTLRHAQPSGHKRPLVIWALGMERDRLRRACEGFQKLQSALPACAPVLVTDVADFAFFSRLGWLVEYVPTLSPPADHYAHRKQRYLAWLYRDAAAVPASVGLSPVSVEELIFALAAPEGRR